MSITDISKQKHAEEALRGSEERHKNIVELAPVGIITLNRKGIITSCNRSYLKLVGFSEDEFVGKHFSKLDYLRAKDIPKFVKLFGSLLKGEKTEPFEAQGFKKDGTPIWSEVHIGLLKKGNKISGIQAIVRDITERKQAEENLTKQLDFMNNVLESLTHPFYVINTSDYTIALANSSARFDKEYRGKTCYELTHGRSEPCDRSHGELCPLETVKKTKNPVEVEHIHYDKNGDEIFYEVHGYPIFNDDREVVQMIEYTLDITEQKKAEEAEQEIRERYQTLIESSEDLIYLISRDLVYLYVNEKLLSRLDLTPDKVVGKEYRKFHSANSTKKFSEKVEEVCKSSKSIVYEHKSDRDGGYFLRTLSPVKNPGTGEIAAVTVISKDITENKHIVEKMRAYNKQLRALHDASQTLVTSLDFNAVVDKCASLAKELMDADGVVIYLLNPERTRLQPIVSKAPYSKQIMSMPLELGEGVTGEVAVSGKAEIVNRVDLIDRGKQIPGTPLEAESLLSAPLKTHEEVIGVMTLNRLGEREFSQDDLTLFDNLANINAAAIQNARLYKQAQKELTDRKRMEAQLLQTQKMEVIGTLGGRIAHEINNRLTSVLGYADLCLLKLKKEDKLYKYIKSMQENTRNAAGVAQQLLYFSKKQPSRRKDFGLDKLIQSLKEIVNQALGRTIELNIKLNSDNAIIHADPTLIEQMIMNLVINARDAMPDGGKLLIETSRLTVDGEFKFPVAIPYGTYLKLVISDTGIGMSPEVMEKIFEPFFTTKDEAVATGLGLSIVQRIIKENNGFISVTSEEGKGTTFQILFPLLYQ